MTNLRRKFTTQLKPQVDAINMPVKITGYETSVYKDKPTDFILGVNTLTGQDVKVFLKENENQTDKSVTVAALNPENNHRHAIPVGGHILCEGSYNHGGGIYYSRYAKKNYSQNYEQYSSNLMGSFIVRNGRPGVTDGALFLRVYNPKLSVMVEAKQSVDNTYYILEEAFGVDFPEIPDSDKFSRSVMVRIRQGDEWATNTVSMPIVKDEETQKNRMSTPKEAIDILRNGQVDKYKNAQKIKEFLDGLGEYDSVEMIPVCSLTFGKDEKDKYFDKKSQKMLEIDTKNFEEMDGLTKRSAIYVNHMKDLSHKVLNYDDGTDGIVPTFFDINIMMFKSKSPEDADKRPFIVNFGPVNGGQNVPRVEAHDIPTINFDPESMLEKKFEAFGELQSYDSEKGQGNILNQSQAQQVVKQPDTTQPQPDTTQPKDEPQLKQDDETMTIGDDFDDDLMAEMEGLLNPQNS